MAPSLEIPRSTLMHVSLACSSIEIRTVDAIISSQTACALPLEILLLIRAYLLIEVTNHLIIRSASALQRYERSLRYLLCPDCIAYNQDVYGNDVWGWEQFSGACACFNPRNRSISSLILFRSLHSSIPTFSSPSLNPRKFADQHHWLEFYLSMKASRLIRNRPYHGSADGIDSRAIWDLVSSVLEGYGCQSVRAHRPYGGRNFTSVRRYESCLVIPREPLQLNVTEENSNNALQRVDRDLALSVEYTSHPAHHHDTSSINPPSRSNCPTWQSTPLIDQRYSTVSENDHDFGLSGIVYSLQSIVLAALSIPLSIVTVFLTIVCFYTRPGALRVL